MNIILYSVLAHITILRCSVDMRILFLLSVTYWHRVRMAVHMIKLISPPSRLQAHHSSFLSQVRVTEFWW